MCYIVGIVVFLVDEGFLLEIVRGSDLICFFFLGVVLLVVEVYWVYFVMYNVRVI